MSKKTDRAPMLRSITVTSTDGTIEKEFKEVDCAIVCTSKADSPSTETLIFSECNLPTIIAVIKAAKKACDKFVVGGVPAIECAKLFDAISGDDDGDDEEKEDEEEGEDDDEDDADEFARLLNRLEKISAILNKLNK